MNNNYLWIPNHFLLVFMAGRTMNICGFQTNFRRLFFTGTTPFSAHSICGKSIFWKLRLADNTKVFLWIPNKFPHTVLAGRTTIICGFQTFCTLLWQEEQRLFVDSKPFSDCVYGGKNNNYLWIPNQFPHKDMAGRTTIICGFQTIFSLCLWREEQRLFVDSKTFSACVYGGKNNDY